MSNFDYLRMLPIADLQKSIDHRVEEFANMSREMSTVIGRLREALDGRCDHIKTEPFQWEHDNGYGRQHMIEGRRCTHCRWLQLWANDSNWIDPKDFRGA